MKVSDIVGARFDHSLPQDFGEEEKVGCLVNSTWAVLLVRVCVLVWLILGGQCACSGGR